MLKLHSSTVTIDAQGIEHMMIQFNVSPRFGLGAGTYGTRLGS